MYKQPVVKDDLVENPKDESVNIRILNNDNDPDGYLLRYRTPLRPLREATKNHSFDETSVALAPTDAKFLEDYDDKSRGADMKNSNVRVISCHHGCDFSLRPALDICADVVDSVEENSPEGRTTESSHGQMIGDEYVPDAEAMEKERPKLEKE